MMKHKWIALGLAVFLISGFGWVVSVIVNVITLGAFRSVANVFGYVALMSLPVSIAIAILFRKGRE